MGILSDLTGSGGRRRAAAGQAGAEQALGQGYSAAQGYLDPYQQAGTGALNQLVNFDPSAVASDPAYQFQLQQGLGALENSAAARGGLISGANLASQQQFGQGLATDFANQQYGRLSDLANLGYGAGGQLAGISSNYGANLANVRTGGAAAQNAATQAGLGNLAGLAGGVGEAYLAGGGGAAGVGTAGAGAAGAGVASGAGGAAGLMSAEAAGALGVPTAGAGTAAGGAGTAGSGLGSLGLGALGVGAVGLGLKGASDVSKTGEYGQALSPSNLVTQGAMSTFLPDSVEQQIKSALPTTNRIENAVQDVLGFGGPGIRDNATEADWDALRQYIAEREAWVQPRQADGSNMLGQRQQPTYGSLSQLQSFNIPGS